MARKLTRRYFTYEVQKWEVANEGKSVVDLMDVGRLSVDKMLKLIVLGNSTSKNKMPMEEAGELLDTFLKESEDNSLIEAYFTLLEELDMDLKLLKASGISIKELRESFKQELTKQVNKTVINAAKEDVDTDAIAADISSKLKELEG